jgi:tRNA dimethylallyltransferase
MSSVMKNLNKSILAVVGPTASGKTDLGLRIAKERNGEIVSVDSRQVYRHLSVGTAKPQGVWSNSTYMVKDIPYHLVDIWEPSEAFTAAHFVRLASEKIADIQQRGKLPLLVGGTGLYFKTLLEGMAELPHADPVLRLKLRAVADEKGRPYLHEQLAKVDPTAAKSIPPNNIQRVMRALEVHTLTGKPISVWHQEHQERLKKHAPAYDLQMIGIDLPKEELHLRIEDRCIAMLENGMIEETEALLAKGIAPDCPGLTGLGYPRVVAYLDGSLDGDHLSDAMIGDTRQYAKRQMTWFRNQFDVDWTSWKTL